MFIKDRSSLQQILLKLLYLPFDKLDLLTFFTVNRMVYRREVTPVGEQGSQGKNIVAAVVQSYRFSLCVNPWDSRCRRAVRDGTRPIR